MVGVPVITPLADEEDSGPRRLVFGSIKGLQQGDGPVPANGTITPGSVRFQTSSAPALHDGQIYTITTTQDIAYTDAASGQLQPQEFQSQQRISVVTHPYKLDASMIHSVYPPPGHADYSNVLPHVLLEDASFPWKVSPSQTSPATEPWLGLLTFTEDEMALSGMQMQTIDANAKKTLNLAYSMPLSSLMAMQKAGSVSTPIEMTDAHVGDSELVQVLFIQPKIFATIFSSSGTVQKPSVGRFSKLCSVRTVNAAGMSNQPALGYQDFASVTSPRTGPLDNPTPIVLHAHLISLAGLTDNAVFLDKAFSTDPSKMNAVISLYSWSYTCLPAPSSSLRATLSNIGNTIQPLRRPDPLLRSPSTNVPIADDWVKDRMLGGYNLIKYRAVSGGVSLGIHRGVLSPVKPANIDLPPSDFGTDLAVMDQATGMLDLSFQLAWQLGKLMMASDKSTSAAVMRLRRDCHSEAAAQAKTTAIQAAQQISGASVVYVTKEATLSQISGSIQATRSMRPSNAMFTNGRWQKYPVTESTKTTFSFQAATVQSQYVKQLGNSQALYSRGTPTQIEARAGASGSAPSACYNELNCPLSTDYAVLLAWCMDRWYLQGIPFHYLLPEPAAVPKECLRTFYIDQNWFKVFLDGALSVSEHFTSNDQVRESIKLNVDDYLKTTLVQNTLPLIPQWGFMLRSDIVSKFPDLRISAPRSSESNEDTEHDGRPEILRMDTIDDDLMLVLFDRQPSQANFPSGITIHGPEHQLNSSLGDAGDLTPTQLTFRYKPVTAFKGAEPVRLADVISSKVFLAADQSSSVFDFENRLLQPLNLLDAANQDHGLDASIQYLNRTGWVATADSENASHPASYVLDGNPSTFWHTEWQPTAAPLPHRLTIDMKQPQWIFGLDYMRRTDGTPNGIIGNFMVDVSLDGTNWGASSVASGNWPNTEATKRVRFAGVRCRFVRLTATSEAENLGYQWTSCAEINILGDSSSSMLASQLIAEVPKLQITCAPDAQVTPAVPGRISSSMPRPSINMPPAATRKLSKNTNPPTTRINLSAATQNFPKLKAIARTDLHLDNPDRVDLALWQNTFKGLNNDWNLRPGLNLNDPPGNVSPLIVVNAYNIRALTNRNPTLRSAAALMPFELGFCSDLQIAMTTSSQHPGYVLSQVTVALAVGVGSLQIPTILRPFAGGKLPNVRLAAPGRRWVVNQSFDGNKLKIAMTPNNSQGQWDITQPEDLSLVIENTQLSWVGTADDFTPRPYLIVTEQYSSVPSSQKPGSAIGYTAVEIRKVDVTSA